MSIETTIFDWVRELYTGTTNTPKDAETINSSDADKYANLGEAFRDLKQVIRDQSLSHGWGTLAKWKYFKNDTTGSKFSRYNPVTPLPALATKLDWDLDTEVVIKLAGTALQSLGAASTDAATNASLDFPTGTMFVIFDASGSADTWYAGYIQDTYMTGGDDSDFYFRASGLFKYTATSLPLSEADQGLLPVTAVTDLDTVNAAGSYIVFSNHATRVASSLLGGHGAINARGGYDRYNYTQKIVNWGSTLPTDDYPRKSILQLDDSYGTVASIGNVPHRKEMGTFIMEGAPSSDPNNHALYPGTTGRVSVALAVPAAVGGNYDPKDVQYPVFLTPVHVHGTPGPGAFQVKDITRYVTGFRVRFVEGLAAGHMIIWQWLVIRDFN
jgi:hypothetical protein